MALGPVISMSLKAHMCLHSPPCPLSLPGLLLLPLSLVNLLLYLLDLFLILSDGFIHLLVTPSLREMTLYLPLQLHLAAFSFERLSDLVLSEGGFALEEADNGLAFAYEIGFDL